MPIMADIIVKKSDNTTNVTYSALQPSSGDGVSATWRSETAGSQPNVKPTLVLASRWNGPRTARRVDFSFVYPQKYTDTATSLDAVANKVILSGNVLVPAAVPDTDIAEAIAQGTNLLVSTLVRDSFKIGYAPT